MKSYIIFIWQTSTLQYTHRKCILNNIRQLKFETTCEYVKQGRTFNKLVSTATNMMT